MSQGYEALLSGAAWLDLSARGRILARGRDRARLLHNISSNEVKKMAPGSSCYAFLLSPQGRIQADLHLVCFEDHFLIDTEPDLREKVERQILKYRVADQVELEDVTAQTAAIGVEGPAAESIVLPGGDHSVAPFTVTGQPGYRVYCAAADMAGLVRQLEAAGARPATLEDARIVRIENGKPVYGEDIRETSLPQETQQMHAVSFTKGCYIGQEIVERIRALGQVHRKLERIELEGAEPVAAGTKLTVGGREAEITSSVYSPRLAKAIALAYVRG
ncbi:Glycine cleavage T protein (Aminomethyl transferase) [Candidatus Sulfopaludibacter sp. SbA6]|nr:Glycine cleavage T protein (Aminomethyl transferase) [Candidatus Sulfopaludibacter sp. SbA6]